MNEAENERMEAETLTCPRVSWGAVAGAAFGLSLAGIWALRGFWFAVLAALLAIVGGVLGAYYVGDAQRR